MKVWGVCLYEETEGNYQMEFVRASDSDDAEAQAMNLNEIDGLIFSVVCAAEMPEGL